MKPLIWDKQLGLGSPLECAAIPSRQTNNPSRNETGLDASHYVSPEGRGKNCFLDILFHRITYVVSTRGCAAIPTSSTKFTTCKASFAGTS